MTMQEAADKRRSTAIIFAAILVFSLGNQSLAYAQQPLVISGETNPDVKINLKYSSGSANVPTKISNHSPKRIIDGDDVIVLVPPRLQKTDSGKIVTPRSKPKISLPETVKAPMPPTPKTKPKIATEETKVAEAAKESTPVPQTKPMVVASIPTPAINPAKLPVPEPVENVKSTEIVTPLPAQTSSKLETMVDPVAETNSPALPTPAEAKDVKEKVAEQAAEKVQEVEVESKKAATEEVQVAAVDPNADAKPELSASEVDIGRLTRILYETGQSKLPTTAEAQIQAVAEQITTDRKVVQLIAHASGDSNSAARRLSLSRALAVRSRLMALGVENSKIEVRALGMPETGGPENRVDLVLIAR
jgi:outer membrane protein OmpA-like peptidoglycan-associated protein